MKTFALCVLLALHCGAAEKTYDVVIAGAGTGGVSAAIEAARHGARVALLEETDWIGGQMTAAGVPNMDEHFDNVESGIYHEFISRVQADYASRGQSISTCYWSSKSHCFEPHVGQRILYEMIASAGGVLDVKLRARVDRVLATGNRVEGVVTSSGETLRSKVLIDATEYGDVLPLSPAGYRTGKYIGKDADPNGCVQWITYTAVVKKYTNGVPEELRMKNPPPGYTNEVREKFARAVRADGNPKDRVLPVNWGIHNAYRGLPDSSGKASYTGKEPEKITKTVLNWFNDYPVKISWLDRANRKKVNCDAKLKTLQFLYYVQHDLGEPLWSVADEGYDTPYNREENLCDNIPAEFKAIERQFPVMPYVRESRRMIGLQTLTASDIRREGTPPLAARSFATSIALGDYPVDLHGCSEESTLETDLERTSDRPAGSRGGLFQIPLETLIPLKADGFLAAEKNISQTRLTNGATRLQPITMLTGQAAGLLAALAVKKGVQPRAVDPLELQRILLGEKTALSPVQFSDVPRDNPRWPAVQLACLRGWMHGADKDTFKPEGKVIRRSAALMISQRAGLTKPFSAYRPSPASKPSFIDVPLYDRQAAEIEALHKVGAAAPCSTDPARFCPEQPITRAEFATMLSKALRTKVQLDGPGQAPLTRGEAAEMLIIVTIP